MKLITWIKVYYRWGEWMWRVRCQCTVPACPEMSGSENVPHCPCVAVCLIELSHDPSSSGYMYDLVPLGWAMMECDILKCISKGEQEQLTQWQMRRLIKLKLMQCPLCSRVGVWTAKDDIEITHYTHCIPELGSEPLRTSKSHVTPTVFQSWDLNH